MRRGRPYTRPEPRSHRTAGPGTPRRGDSQRADRDLPRATPGVGPVAAHAVLAGPPDPARFATAQQAVAHAGPAPCEFRPGTSVRKRTRLSKAGNARLHLPAMTAVRFNPNDLGMGGAGGVRRTLVGDRSVPPGVERCQVRTARGQRNRTGRAIRAFVRLECHRFTTGVSWFEAKWRIVREAVRAYLADPLCRLPAPATA